MQFKFTDTRSVKTMENRLRRFGQFIAAKNVFVLGSLQTLGRTFEDEDYEDIRRSFERMNSRMEDVLPQIDALCGRLSDLYDFLLEASLASRD